MLSEAYCRLLMLLEVVVMVVHGMVLGWMPGRDR
jgi:hypothetical protein